uniref:Ribonuclease 3 n=1 Tax=Lygus hesperus TaxID=30085 RepID=A0A0A9X996_LYGHE
MDPNTQEYHPQQPMKVQIPGYSTNYSIDDDYKAQMDVELEGPKVKLLQNAVASDMEANQQDPAAYRPGDAEVHVDTTHDSTVDTIDEPIYVTLVGTPVLHIFQILLRRCIHTHRNEMCSP